MLRGDCRVHIDGSIDTSTVLHEEFSLLGSLWCNAEFCDRVQQLQAPCRRSFLPALRRHERCRPTHSTRVHATAYAWQIAVPSAAVTRRLRASTQSHHSAEMTCGLSCARAMHLRKRRTVLSAQLPLQSRCEPNRCAKLCLIMVDAGHNRATSRQASAFGLRMPKAKAAVCMLVQAICCEA